MLQCIPITVGTVFTLKAPLTGVTHDGNTPAGHVSGWKLISSGNIN